MCGWTIRTWLAVAMLGTVAWAGVCGAEASFEAFYGEFVKAVAAGDKARLADMCLFDGFAWEGPGGPVADRTTFLAQFVRLFTPAIRKSLQKARPVKVDADRYFTAWKVGGNEYSFNFVRRPDGGFAFLGLSVGPL